MKIQRSIALGLILSNALVLQASAESDAIGPGDSDAKWVLGVGSAISNNIYADEDNLGVIYPKVEYRGERLFFKDGELGFTVYRHGNFSTGVLLTPDYSFLSDRGEYRSNDMLRGLEERDGTIEGGAYVFHTTDYGRTELRVFTDIANEHKGQTASLSYTADLSYGDWYINPYIGAVWASSDKVDHYYGVSAAEANIHRSAYNGSATTSAFAGVRARYAFNEHWDMELNAGATRFGSGITDSSIVDEKTAYHAGVSVNYNF